VKAQALLIPVVVLALVLAGCGSTRVVTVTAPAPPVAGGQPVSTTAKVTGPVARGRGSLVSGTAGSGFELPRAPRETQCEVSRGTTEIIVYSEPLQVAKVCQAQTDTGEWKSGYESAVPVGSEYIYCYLRNGAATVTASVSDTLVSQRGAAICQALIRKGYWVEAQANTTACRIGGTIYTEPPGTRCS
jgi:hypothetical protein